MLLFLLRNLTLRPFYFVLVFFLGYSNLRSSIVQNFPISILTFSVCVIRDKSRVRGHVSKLCYIAIFPDRIDHNDHHIWTEIWPLLAGGRCSEVARLKPIVDKWPQFSGDHKHIFFNCYFIWLKSFVNQTVAPWHRMLVGLHLISWGQAVYEFVTKREIPIIFPYTLCQ